jgi:RNA polymerase sigma factor for flagellar operon FliA
MSATPDNCAEVRPGLLEPKPGPKDLWQRYHATGPGDSSEDDLVKSYLPLVKTVVGRLAITLPPHVNGDDLYSAALVGLLNALRQFNPNIGTAFEPYARVRIRGAVLDELRRMDWVPRSIHLKARKIQETMKELEQKTGAIPGDEEVAAALKIPLSEYEQWLEEVRPATFLCLDAVSFNQDGDSDATEHEVLSDEAQDGPFEKVSRAELARLVADRIKQLPETQRKILALYYYEGLRLREIAEAFGFCESHICQLHAKAILAIKSYLEQHESTGAEATQRRGEKIPLNPL